MNHYYIKVLIYESFVWVVAYLGTVGFGVHHQSFKLSVNVNDINFVYILENLWQFAKTHDNFKALKSASV